MPDRTTLYRRIGGVLPESPSVVAWHVATSSTGGQVTAVSRGPVGGSDTATVTFQGKSLSATCAHPGIVVGDTVSMIEQRPGVFWATKQQNSWFRRPLADLIAKGKPVTAALEYMLSKGRKFVPEIKVTLNTNWTLTIESSPLFPAYVWFIQTLDGEDRPSNTESEVPADLRVLWPNYYGENALAVPYTGSSERVYSGASGATLKQFIIIVGYGNIHYANPGDPPTYEWFPSEAHINQIIDSQTVTSTVEGYTPVEITSGVWLDEQAEITPPTPGDYRTERIVWFYQVAL